MRLAFISLAVPVIALAQAAAQPRLTLETTHYDFGRLPPDTAITHRFKLTNTGNAPLLISRLSVSCGCTSSVVGKQTLDPGESTGLEVTYDSTGNRGPIQKSVTVASNDPILPLQTLTFEADVATAVKVADDQVWFENLAPGDRRKRSVRLESGTGQPIQVTAVDLSPAPWLGVATRMEGNDLWVDFTLLARNLPPGRLAGIDTATLQVQNPKPSTVTLTVHWVQRRSPEKARLHAL
jgi:hypothetical protein